MFSKTMIVAATALIAAIVGSGPAAAQSPPQPRSLGGAVLFNLIDKNGDGVIDQAEAEAIAKAVFAAADQNKDGTLSASEIGAAMRQHALGRMQMRQPRARSEDAQRLGPQGRPGHGGQFGGQHRHRQHQAHPSDRRRFDGLQGRQHGHRFGQQGNHFAPQGPGPQQGFGPQGPGRQQGFGPQGPGPQQGFGPQGPGRHQGLGPQGAGPQPGNRPGPQGPGPQAAPTPVQPNPTSQQQQQRRLQRMPGFAAIDTNGDGQISPEEFAAAFPGQPGR